jgi:hypothetical protein
MNFAKAVFYIVIVFIWGILIGFALAAALTDPHSKACQHVN